MYADVYTSSIGRLSLVVGFPVLTFFFFFNDTATTEIYTLSLHDALPICYRAHQAWKDVSRGRAGVRGAERSEEHTSELQSQSNLVCRLLLEKKKKKTSKPPPSPTQSIY